MDELIERFLKYIYRKNTQSEKTIESYKNDLNQFKEYLTSQSIDSFESCDRLTLTPVRRNRPGAVKTSPYKAAVSVGL